MRGPILRYFVQTVRTISRTRFIERFCRTAAFREFRQASEATLEELRLLAIQLAMCLGVPDKVHPMDALTATVAHIFVLDIKTIPALLHITNQPRQNQTIALRRMTRRTLCLNARTPPKNFSSDFESESPQS